MQAISSLATSAKTAVWGDSPQPSGEEPPSGETGKGSVEEPYDAGNAPEQHEVSEATANPPEISPAAADTTTSGPASAVENNERKPSMSNARMPSFALRDTATGSVADPNSAPVEDQASAAAKPLEEPSSGAVVKDDTNPTDAVTDSEKKRNQQYSPFDAKDSSASEDTTHLRAERHLSEDRSVSPGTRPDGGHAETGKVEKQKFGSKLKEKLHIGGKH